MTSSITLHHGDLPASVLETLGASVAIDTETMGLNPLRDRLCLVQIANAQGAVHLVKFAAAAYDAPNLKSLMTNPAVLKIFHFARFDLAAILAYLGVMPQPVYCTKTASRLCRTFTDRHGLKDLCRDLLGIELSKQQQSSDWGAESLTEEQQAYAASDVLHLHALKAKLDAMLLREGRTNAAEACFSFLPVRAGLDLAGWENLDIFAH